jgi:hypothetical protein
MEEKRNAYRLLVGKLEGKRTLGRPRRRWVDNIRMDFGEVGWGDEDWIGLAQDRNRWRALVNSVLVFGIGLTSSGLSSSVYLHRDSLLSRMTCLGTELRCVCDVCTEKITASTLNQI